MAIDQEINDYDWFAVDNEGKIGHFTSEGGVLPRSVAVDAEELQSLVAYFNSSAIEENNFNQSSFLSFPEGITTDLQRENFVHCYAQYSRRGLYSFSRILQDSHGKEIDFLYRIVTVPAKPLLINELPIKIQSIIFKTKYTASFSSSVVINLFQLQGFTY